MEYLKEVKELFLAEESEQRAYKGVGLECLTNSKESSMAGGE